MRRIILAFALVAIAAGLVFAEGQADAKASSTKKTTLLWYVWDDPETQGHKEIAAEFMKNNPNYEITFSRTPFAKYEETIRTILAGGDVPDVIQVNDDFVPLYASSGWLAPLDEISKDWTIQRKDTYTNFWDFNFYNGKMVSVTPNIKVRFHLYNKDLFDQAGLAEPPAKWADSTWTWDAALNAAKKITKTEGNRTSVWGWSVTQDATAAAMWIDNNIPGQNDMYDKEGKKFLGATQPGWEAMQYLVDLSYKHGVQPPWGTNQNGTNTENMFQSGQMGLIMTGSWIIPAMRTNAKFNWNVTSNPMKVEGNTQASLVCFGIPSGAKNKPASGKFLSFLMEEFTAKTWALNGYGIPTVKAYAAKYYVNPKELPSRQQVIVDGLEVGFPPVFTVNTGKAKAAWDASYKLTWSGEKPAKDIMLAVKDEVEASLNAK